MEQIIGRQKEMAELWRCYNSARSEFVIVYGRRRIGKTFLVNRTFGGRMDLYFTGSHKSSEHRQLELFARLLSDGLGFKPSLANWYDAFDALQAMLERQDKKKRKLIFFDEMPWIDTYKSDFVAALEDFWNMWAAQRDDICLVACGSSTSWMVDKLVKNQGGLHNRITSRIYLRPFCLAETEQYLQAIGCCWDRYTTLQCYMAMGGVPFYLSLIDPTKSLPQNIDSLFFSRDGKLYGEFDELYDVLFHQADGYKQVARLLSAHREGLTRQEILNKAGISGGQLTTMLDNLEQSDFIISYQQFGNKKKGKIYRLSDFYSLFYFRFIENKGTKESHYWEKAMLTPAVTAWQGLTFELVCLTHLGQIKQRLGLSVIATTASSWRSSGIFQTDNGNEGQRQAQIDLVIARADRIINICEIKFSTSEYVITRDYETRLRQRMAIFASETKTRHTLVPTFVTTYGLLPGTHSSMVQQQVVMDDLFVQ